MSIMVDAVFENGVFVPTQRPALSEHEKVRLTVESVTFAASAIDVVRRRRDRRIELNPTIAKEIALAPEFHPDEGLRSYGCRWI